MPINLPPNPTAEQIADKFFALLKIEMPDEFYEKPQAEKETILNQKFDAHLKTLDDEERRFLLEVSKIYARNKGLYPEQQLVRALRDQIALEKSAELSGTIKFTSIQKKKLEKKH